MEYNNIIIDGGIYPITGYEKRQFMPSADSRPLAVITTKRLYMRQCLCKKAVWKWDTGECHISQVTGLFLLLLTCL